MLWTPQEGAELIQHNGGDIGASAPGDSVTTGATSATKGVVSQIFSSTSFDAYWVTVVAGNYGSTGADSRGCLDIMIGAALSESVLIPDLLMGYSGSFVSGTRPKRWDFPLYIPAGVRISARAAGARVLTAVQVLVYLYGGHGSPKHRVGGRVDTYGIGTVPDAVDIAPGASGAQGSWTQIVASTSRDHFAAIPSLQVDAETSVADRSLTTGIAIGAAAAETQIGASAWWFTDAIEAVGGPMLPAVAFGDIPSGSRLSMRASASGSTDAMQGALHCVS